MVKPHFLRKLAASLLMVLLVLGLTAELGVAASWSFAVLGDQRDEGSYGINQTIVAAMAAEIASKNPAFVLCAGDQIHGVDRHGQASLPDQYTHWKAAMGPILSISYPVRGNHETYGEVNTPGPDYAKNWMDNIGNVLTQIPKNGPPNEVGMSYSFSRNNAFIIGLEQSYATSWYQVNQPWLNSQLAANTLPFTFVYGHYPAFGFAENLEPGSLADNPTQRDAFWKSLGDNSVNIYFAGHVHVYNRAEISINGGPLIQQIVIGTGGAPLTTWDGTYSDSRVIGESHLEGQYGYSLVTVDGNKITVVYYAYDSSTDKWSPFDTYSYTMTSRKFGANDANQSLDPATLTNYYQGIRLAKIGSGTLTLNPGSSTYSDSITVSGGTLNVQGDYSQAPVTVQSGSVAILGDAGKTGWMSIESGATLGGTGTVVGTLSNAGTVTPGQSPGTLNVVGSYTQSSGGALNVEIESPINYGKINVTGTPGTASLNGTVAPTLLNGYLPSINQSFPGIITTSGGLTGTFSQIDNQRITLTLFWQPYYDSTSFGLQAVGNYTYPDLNLTPNQFAVGSMLNSVSNSASGDLVTVLNGINSLTTNEAVQNSYKQISPEKASALTTLGFASATFQVRNLSNRITNLRYEALGATGGAGGLSLNYSRLEGMMLAYNGSLSGLLTGKKERSQNSRWGVFADAGGVIGSQKTSVNQTGFDFGIIGLTAGADYRVRDNLLVGLATGYSHTSASFHGSGGGMGADTLPLNAYAAYIPGQLYAYGSLGYALNLFDLKRQVSFDSITRTANSSPAGHQLNIYGETGYDLPVSRVIFTPILSLAYSHIWVNGFSESAAGALNLNVSPQAAASLQTGVGGRVAVPLKVGQAKVMPQFYASYQHEFSNNSRGLDARLNQGSSTFTWQTDKPKRDFAVLGASLTTGITKNLQAQINYNAEVGRGNYTAHFVNAGLRFEF